MKDAVIRARIGADLKEQSVRVLAECGLDPSEAIRLFLRQVVVHGGIPFAVHGRGSRVASAASLRVMKRASQSRDRRIAASEDLSGGEMLLIRPEEARGAIVRWPSRGRR